MGKYHKLNMCALAGGAMLMMAGQGFSAESSLPFLKMNVGAHAQSMGGAYMAESRDGSANSWNPSAIATAEKSDIFLYHSQFVSGYTYDYLAYSHPFQSHRAGFGAAVAYLHKGDFQARNENGDKTGDFQAHDALATITYSRKFSPNVSIGIGANYIQSSIESASANAFAIDFSGSYRVSEKLNLAAGAFHLGPQVSYASQSYDLPAQVAGGVSYRLFGPLTLTSDARYGLYDNNFTMAFGGQMNVAQAVSFRLGYTSQIAQTNRYAQNSDNQFNNMTGLGMGMGLKVFSHANLDYAFVPMGELGGTHHVDLSWRY